MKRYTYLEATLDALFVERAKKDGETFGEWIKAAIILRLGTTNTEPKVVKKEEPDYGDLKQKGIRMSRTEWRYLGAYIEENGFKSYSAAFRAWTREKLDVPEEPKVKRAPRDPELSAAIIIEEQVEQFNGMRNLRIAQEGKLERKWLEIWERIRANPEEFFPVNVCRVNLCRLSDLGLHRHPGKLLADYADAVEAGERT